MTDNHYHIHRDKEPDKKPANTGIETDSAMKSLSEALRISFIVLKLIMIALIIFFIGSGFRTVKPDERAIVLRFGKIRGTGEERVLKSRTYPYWVFPYPIEQMVNIPVEKKIDLDIDSFWYFQTDQEKLSDKKKTVSPGKPLDPLIDGYCLTRSDIRASQSQAGSTLSTSSGQAGSGESDYNIIHTRWRLTYQIIDPVSFYKNVYIEDPMPNQIYFDVVKKDVAGVLKDVIDSAIVSTMVNFTIDEALYEKFGTVADNVKDLAQQKLDRMESGIRIVSIQRVDNTWPLQVNEAFLASINASQTKQQQISEATTYARNIINEAGGPVAVELLAAISDPNSKPETLESLWLQVAGKAQERIAEARAYRKKVVESARADAEYLKQILPEYKKRPTLVISELYRNAMSVILNSAEEKFFIEPVQTDKGSVIMIKSNSDPTLKPK